MIITEEFCPEGTFYGISQIPWGVVASGFKLLAHTSAALHLSC